jgi:hypothetical protein
MTEKRKQKRLQTLAIFHEVRQRQVNPSAKLWNSQSLHPIRDDFNRGGPLAFRLDSSTGDDNQRQSLCVAKDIYTNVNTFAALIRLYFR